MTAGGDKIDKPVGSGCDPANQTCPDNFDNFSPSDDFSSDERRATSDGFTSDDFSSDERRATSDGFSPSDAQPSDLSGENFSPSDDFDRDPRHHAKLLSRDDDRSRWLGGLFGAPLSASREFKMPQYPTRLTPREKADIRRRALMAPLVAELEALLGPCTRTGIFSPSAAPAETLDEFIEYLKTHAAMGDNMSYITPYCELLDRKEFRPLLQALYERVNPDSKAPFKKASEANDLLRQFTAELIRISPEAFVANHFSSADGRERIRRAVHDFWNYDRDLSADLCKAVANAAKGIVPDYMVEDVTSQISSFNYFNIGVSEEEIKKARDAAVAILDGADKVFAAREERFGRLAEEPVEPALVLLSDKETIRRYAALAREKAEKIDPVSRLQAHLANAWLLAVADERWVPEESFYSYHENFVRRYIAGRAEKLIRAGENVDTESELERYNDRVQLFLHQELFKFNPSAWILHETSGASLVSYMSGLPTHIRSRFDALATYSDKLHHATDMGRRVSPAAPVVGMADKGQKAAVTALVMALQESVLDMWYSYKQHRAISRAGSETRMFLREEGDIADIRRAERILDGFIRRLENAEDSDEIKNIITELYGSLRAGGDIHNALLSAEMEGIEQLLGFAQTSAEFVILALATKGFGLPAAAGRLASILRAFGAGAFVAFSENTIAVATGEVRQGGQDTLISWLIDSAATGLAAAVTAFARVPKSDHPNILGRLYERYTSEGFRGFAETFGADAGIEPIEELIDAYVNQALHGDFGALSWEEVTEIFRICAVGGATGVAQAKVGAIAEFTGRAVRQAVPAVPASPSATTAKRGDRKKRTESPMDPDRPGRLSPEAGVIGDSPAPRRTNPAAGITWRLESVGTAAIDEMARPQGEQHSSHTIARGRTAEGEEFSISIKFAQKPQADITISGYTAVVVVERGSVAEVVGAVRVKIGEGGRIDILNTKRIKNFAPQRQIVLRKEAIVQLLKEWEAEYSRTAAQRAQGAAPATKPTDVVDLKTIPGAQTVAASEVPGIRTGGFLRLTAGTTPAQITVGGRRRDVRFVPAGTNGARTYEMLISVESEEDAKQIFGKIMESYTPPARPPELLAAEHKIEGLMEEGNIVLRIRFKSTEGKVEADFAEAFLDALTRNHELTILEGGRGGMAGWGGMGPLPVFGIFMPGTPLHRAGQWLAEGAARFLRRRPSATEDSASSTDPAKVSDLLDKGERAFLGDVAREAMPVEEAVGTENPWEVLHALAKLGDIKLLTRAPGVQEKYVQQSHREDHHLKDIVDKLVRATADAMSEGDIEFLPRETIEDAALAALFGRRAADAPRYAFHEAPAGSHTSDPAISLFPSGGTIGPELSSHGNRTIVVGQRRAGEERFGALTDQQGRTISGARIRVNDTRIGQNHLMITRSNGNWVVTDLGSANGTYANGTRLRNGEQSIIRPGDIIQAGGQAWVVGFEGRGERDVHKILTREEMQYLRRDGSVHELASAGGVLYRLLENLHNAQRRPDIVEKLAVAANAAEHGMDADLAGRLRGAGFDPATGKPARSDTRVYADDRPAETAPAVAAEAVVATPAISRPLAERVAEALGGILTRGADGQVTHIAGQEIQLNGDFQDTTERGSGLTVSTHTGIGYKQRNEDRFIHIRMEDGTRYVFAIDGMGGHRNGERAAEVARLTIDWAIKNGWTMEDSYELADKAVLEALEKTEGRNGGAVVAGAKITRNADGTYDVELSSVGDAELFLFDRPETGGPLGFVGWSGTIDMKTLALWRISILAYDPGQSLGGHYRGDGTTVHVDTKTFRGVSGNFVLAGGSDGATENHLRPDTGIPEVVADAHATTHGQIHDVIRGDALVKMALIDIRKAEAERVDKSGDDSWRVTITREMFDEAYERVHGRKPPRGVEFKYEGMKLDRSGCVYRTDNPNEKPVALFKKDNLTVVVVTAEDAAGETAGTAPDGAATPTVETPPPAMSLPLLSIFSPGTPLGWLLDGARRLLEIGGEAETQTPPVQATPSPTAGIEPSVAAIPPAVRPTTPADIRASNERMMAGDIGEMERQGVFARTEATESMGGGAGNGRFAINVYIDAAGRIVAMGNTQRIPEQHKNGSTPVSFEIASPITTAQRARLGINLRNDVVPPGSAEQIRTLFERRAAKGDLNPEYVRKMREILAVATDDPASIQNALAYRLANFTIDSDTVGDDAAEATAFEDLVAGTRPGDRMVSAEVKQILTDMMGAPYRPAGGTRSRVVSDPRGRPVIATERE